MVLIDPVQGGLDGSRGAPAEAAPVDATTLVRRARLVGDLWRVVAAEQSTRGSVAVDDLGARDLANRLDQRR